MLGLRSICFDANSFHLRASKVTHDTTLIFSKRTGLYVPIIQYSFLQNSWSPARKNSVLRQADDQWTTWTEEHQALRCSFDAWPRSSNLLMVFACSKLLPASNRVVAKQLQRVEPTTSCCCRSHLLHSSRSASSRLVEGGSWLGARVQSASGDRDWDRGTCSQEVVQFTLRLAIIWCLVHTLPRATLGHYFLPSAHFPLHMVK